jgi:hypothetical protein
MYAVIVTTERLMATSLVRKPGFITVVQQLLSCFRGLWSLYSAGTLLGTVIAGVVEVTNCFGVPFVQKGDTVGVSG